MDAYARDRFAPAELSAPAYAADPPAGAAPPWPPPLLEPLLGAAWRAASPAAAGGVLLFAPLLYRLTGDAAAARLTGAVPGWLPELVAAAGLLLLALAASRVRRALAAARAALAAGHGRLTVLEVAADRRGDTGMAIAGEREYRELPPEARTLLRVNRLAAAALAVLAGVLPVAGFLALVLLAYAGAADAGSAWMPLYGLLPAAGGLALGAVALESLLLAGPRRRWAADAVAALAPDVALWAEQFDATCDGAPGRGRAGRMPALRALAAVATLGFVAVAAFAILLGAAAVRARMLVDAAWPRLDAASTRIVGIEAARPYRLPPDPAISPEAAGQALHALLMAGIDDRDPLLRAPARVYDAEWTRPAGPAPFATPHPAADWVHAAAAGLTAEQAAYVRGFASFPAIAELSTLARARTIEIAGTRYVTPFPPTLERWALPWVPPTHLREAGEAMVARAVLALDAGRTADAETMLRELISAGVLVADEAIVPTDALIAANSAALGLTSLQALYDATGRAAEAERIGWLSDAVRRAAAVAGGARAADAGSTLPTGAAPGALALDPAVPRAVRWELASAHVLLSECGSPRHRLFGESDAYREWKEQARAALARSPGEAALFELMLAAPTWAEPTFGPALRRAAAFAARLIPGGPRCSAVWAML